MTERVTERVTPKGSWIAEALSPPCVGSWIALCLLIAFVWGSIALTPLSFGRWDLIFKFLAVVAIPFGLSVGISWWRGDPTFRRVMQAYVFLAASGIASGLAAQIVGISSVPSIDSFLASVDSSLGFDWIAYAAWTSERLWATTLFGYAYHSLLPQLVAAILWLGRSHPRGVDELCSLILLSMIFVLAVAWIAPADGAYAYHAPSDSAIASLNPDVKRSSAEAIRSWRGEVSATIEMSKGTNLIYFPSFHASASLVVLYVMRHARLGFFLWALPLSLVTLASIPVFGDHHLVDMLASVLVVGSAIGCHRAFLRLESVWRFVGCH